jgi:hypothetical protein
MYHYQNHKTDQVPPPAQNPPANPPPANPANTASELDFDWVLITSIMMLLMQLGLAFINSGSVRFKSS